MELMVLDGVFVDEAGDFDVVAAVFGDLEQFAFLEPLDGLHALGGFLDAKSGRGDGIQRDPVLKFALQVHEHVERGELAQVQPELPRR